jgi:hypothetical protein
LEEARTNWIHRELMNAGGLKMCDEIQDLQQSMTALRNTMFRYAHSVT